MGRRTILASIPIALLMTIGSTAWAEPADSPGYVPVAIASPTAESVVVEKGDHLWAISERHLQAELGRAPDDGEVTPYWIDVIETNRDNLRSGDPNLIYPGEVVTLP